MKTQLCSVILGYPDEIRSLKPELVLSDKGYGSRVENAKDVMLEMKM